MTDRLKAVEIALAVLGLFFIFGGWVIEPSGDVALAFPFWLYLLGFALMMVALYLYVMNIQPRKSP